MPLTISNIIFTINTIFFTSNLKVHVIFLSNLLINPLSTYRYTRGVNSSSCLFTWNSFVVITIITIVTRITITGNIRLHAFNGLAIMLLKLKQTHQYVPKESLTTLLCLFKCNVAIVTSMIR